MQIIYKLWVRQKVEDVVGETEGRKISPVPSIPFLPVLRLALHYKHELSLVLAPLPHAPTFPANTPGTNKGAKRD